MTLLLGLIVLVLLFYVLFRIARTSELASVLRGNFYNFEYASKVNSVLLMVFLIGGMFLVVYSAYLYVPKMLPKAASEHGVVTDGLFNTTLWFTGIVFFLTQIVLFWFAYKYRERRGQKALFYTHNNMLEVVWTLIPAVVMTILVVMGLRAWFNIFPDEMPEETMVIEVTAKQFNWIVRYPGQDGEFGERIVSKEYIGDNTAPGNEHKNEMGINWRDPASHDDIRPTEIHMVKDRPTLFRLGALDVLHSFYLPHFRVKMDCVPGIPTKFFVTPNMSTNDMIAHLSEEKWINRDWHEIDPETGAPKYEGFYYELACTEMCGKSHYAMQMKVVVHDTQEEFDEWMSTQQPYYDIAVKPNLPESFFSETAELSN